MMAPLKPRRWLRFSLPTLIFAILLLGIVFGVLASAAREARRQRGVVKELEDAGLSIGFSNEAPLMPELFDTGYCGRVTDVWVNCAHPSALSFSDASPLAEYENLEDLDLSGTHVADVSPLAMCGKLERLDLDGTHVIDISPLGELENLEMLFMKYTQVTDISPLSKLKNLRVLALLDSSLFRFTQEPITAQQVRDLQEALPDCEIDCPTFIGYPAPIPPPPKSSWRETVLFLNRAAQQRSAAEFGIHAESP